MNITTVRLGLVAGALLACGAVQAQSSLTEFRCSTTAGSTNCAGPIPDAPIGTALSSTIPLTATACIGGVRSVQVRLDISHEWVGDLRVRLTSPGAATAIVLDDLAEPAGAAGSCQGDDVNALFATAGTAPACSINIPSVSGNVRSFATLAPLGIETTAGGTWTLDVFDDANDNAGFLNDWSVQAACTVNIPLPGPQGGWLLLALLGVATLGSCVVMRRS